MLLALEWNVREKNLGAGEGLNLVLKICGGENVGKMEKMTAESVERRLWELANKSAGRDVLGQVRACQALLRRIAGRKVGEGGRKR